MKTTQYIPVYPINNNSWDFEDIHYESSVRIKKFYDRLVEIADRLNPDTADFRKNHLPEDTKGLDMGYIIPIHGVRITEELEIYFRRIIIGFKEDGTYHFLPCDTLAEWGVDYEDIEFANEVSKGLKDGTFSFLFNERGEFYDMV